MDMHRNATVWKCLLLATVGWFLPGGTVGQSPESAVPTYFQRLIDAGNVQFEFYNPRTNPRRYPAWTTFNFHVDYRYTCRYDKRQQGPTLNLVIRPTIQRVTCRVTHTMLLPDYLDSDDRWNHALVKHEFDHVAISLDPRPQMLVSHLYRASRSIGRSLSVGTTINNELAGKIINEEMATRHRAVVDLIQFNQDRLDEVTRHGVRPIPDREGFFESLYTKPNLEEARFPYTNDVLGLLGSSPYREASLPYSLEQ